MTDYWPEEPVPPRSGGPRKDYTTLLKVLQEADGGWVRVGREFTSVQAAASHARNVRRDIPEVLHTTRTIDGKGVLYLRLPSDKP